MHQRYHGLPNLVLILCLVGCAGQSTTSPDDVQKESVKKPVAEEQDLGRPNSERKSVQLQEKDPKRKPPMATTTTEGHTQTQLNNPVTEPPLVAVQAAVDETLTREVLDEVSHEAVRDLCQRIGNKLGSVNVQDCLDQPFVHSGTSTEGLSLAYRDYAPLPDRKPLGRVLVLGGIHGDEFSSVSVVFKWLKILDQYHSGLFHWRFAPLTNPDGLLRRKSQRQNANGVDLNRNFPTTDWDTLAHAYWRDKTHNNPRRYPGPVAASEIETRWIIEQIDTFQPDVIISMHAPYHLVDYDGPPEAPSNLGGLYLRKLGVYPGSLGNYVGVDQQKPIVTVELESAGIMPAPQEIESMWRDLVQWLRQQLGP